MIEIFDCSVCKEAFCSDCNEALQCELCRSVICENCEAKETANNYNRNIICQTCFSAQNLEEQSHLKSTKFERKILNPAISQIHKPKNKEDFLSLINKLKGEES